MPQLIQNTYIWDKKERSFGKKNQEMGNILSMFFLFVYFLIYLFSVSGKFYPILKTTDINYLGYISGIVTSLGYITERWWLIFILFLFSLVFCLVLILLLTKTRLSSFRTYIEYLNSDSKKMQKTTLIKQLSIDIAQIAATSIAIFVVVEIIVMGVSSLFLIFILPVILNVTENTLGIVYVVLLVSHIVFFPTVLFVYQFFLRRRMIEIEATDISEFLTENGEVDLEKWRARTWGKKSYTYVWDKDEHIPMTCYACGAVISSNLTECPICQADLLSEFEEIIADYSVEEDEEADKKESDKRKS